MATPNTSTLHTTAPLPDRKGVFVTDSQGTLTIDYLYDGGGFQSELAIFTLDGMEAFQPGSDAFIQAAAQRALSNTEGYILVKDKAEGARFTEKVDWEKNYNRGPYNGIRTFDFAPGTEFALMLVQDTTVEAIAQNPSITHQFGKHAIFSIPEANPNGVEQSRIVDGNGLSSVGRGVYGLEDLSLVDGSDKDYNDIIVQITGAIANVDDIDTVVNPSRDMRQTQVGSDLLEYSTYKTASGLIADTFPTGTTLGERPTVNSLTLNSTLENGDTLNPLFDDVDGSLLQAIDNTSRLKGISDRDILLGDQHNNILNGGGGVDTLVGRSGDDVLNGGGENDTLRGNQGDDLLKGGTGNDRIKGHQGNDFLNGGEDRDLLKGGAGSDILNGDSGRDRLFGNKGNDVISGGSSGDRISGGQGQDTLTGGQGRDVFVFETSQDFGDRITDFEINRDRINLRNVSGGMTSFADFQSSYHMTMDGNDTLIQTNNGQLLARVMNVHPKKLGERNFIL